MVRCRQGHGSVRLLHTSVDIGLRENIYRQRIQNSNAGLRQFLHEKYISSGGKYAKVKSKVETKYDTECKSQTPPPPQDSGCQDRVLLCYAAVARFLLLVPGPWSLVTLTSSAIISAPSPRHLHTTAQSARHQHTPCHS